MTECGARVNNSSYASAKTDDHNNDGVVAMAQLTTFAERAHKLPANSDYNRQHQHHHGHYEDDSNVAPHRQH